MRWHDLCFLHWRVEPELLAPLLPPPLVLDTFDGAAWLGVVPFLMSDVSPRMIPRVRRVADFGELNVRTYVTAGGKPGVWFLSLDAGGRLAVRVARAAFNLPYHDASIALQRDGDTFHYTSARDDARSGAVELDVRYRPTGPPVRSEPGSLEYYLVERYCLYAANRRGHTRRQEVDHVPWPLQPATAEIARCSVTAPFGIPLEGPPMAHFSASLDVVAWLQGRLES